MLEKEEGINKDQQKHLRFVNQVFNFTRKELKGKDFLENLSTSLKLICGVNHKLSFAEKGWNGVHDFVDKKCRKRINVNWSFDNETKKDIPLFKCCGRIMKQHPTLNGISHYFCESCRYKFKLYNQ